MESPLNFMPFSPLERSQSHRLGAVAWAGLATYIVVYDIVAMVSGVPTLSATFHRASLGRWGRIVLIGFWSYLTAHLFRWLPPKFDLFRSFDSPAARRKSPK